MFNQTVGDFKCLKRSLFFFNLQLVNNRFMLFHYEVRKLIKIIEEGYLEIQI